MKITDIEIIPTYPRIAERNAAYTARFHDMNHLTVFKVHTDAGGSGLRRVPLYAAAAMLMSSRSSAAAPSTSSTTPSIPVWAVLSMT